jgi:hypothetical protein
MTKPVYLALMLSFSLNCLSGQSKRDYTWILGYPALIPDQPNSEKFGGMLMKFSKNTYTIENFEIPVGPVSATANDEDGNFQFYTNGCAIYNNQHELMDNGSDINIGAFNYETECDDYKGISYISDGNLVLPLPDHKEKYILFHLRAIRTSDTSGIYDHFQATEIDMSANNNQGRVTQKNQIVVNDSLHDAVAAVRHGNGRDWWIVVPRGNNQEFWKILLTPKGPEEISLQTLPPPYPEFTVRYKVPTDEPPYFRDVVPNEYGFESGAGQSIFSPDGTKYCRVIRASVIEIYDFDRCSGAMILRRIIPLPPYTAYPETPVNACGLAVSPNSRYLYFNNHEALYQFDMCEEQIESGDFILIEEWDKFLQDSQFATNFFQMRNAPNGEIFITSTNTVRSLHVIHEPDKYGKACRFEQRGVQLPRWTSWIINYFPNFRLYDQANSPCDTLGINDPNPPEPGITFNEFRIFPNPASREVMMYVPQCEGVKIQVWNIAGQLITDIPYIPGQEVYALDVSGWPSGTYVLAAYIDSEKPIMKRLVVVH